jgi:oxalate decarboxylase
MATTFENRNPGLLSFAGARRQAISVCRRNIEGRGSDQSGMREVHWHLETAEMGYITQGKGRMTIVSPDGSPDTFEMNQGDVYFIPRAYPHHFEDIGEGDLKLLVFFDQVTPGDIGVRTVVGCYSHEVLAATFKVEPSALPQFPFTTEDPLLVRRINAIDPSKSL